MSNEFSPSGFISDLFMDEKKSESNPLTGQKIIDSREVVLERLTSLMDDEMELVEEKIEVKEMEKTETQSMVVEPKIYTKKEIFNNVVDYFDGDELAAGVWIDKYSLKNEQGDLLEKNPDDMHRRLAKEFARIEKNM